MTDKRGKQKVMHSCGHSRSVTVFDADKVADNQWLQKLEVSDCPTCWLKKQPPGFRLRTRQHGGYAIDVSRGYPIKETLRERGYFFQRPRWIKLFATEDERRGEIDWIEGQGYEVRADD